MTARSIVMTSFGYNDAGGGTTVPRLVSRELARRGWEVTVFHAAVALTGTGIPYELRETEQDGVRLIAVHNRAHGLFDRQHPDRELDDPPITAAFAATLDRLKPDVVHFHNLHNLGARLIDVAAVRGLPAYFSTHNYWLICPRAYLMTGDGSICPGPGDGAVCAPCNAHPDPAAYGRRLAEIRARASGGLTRILAVSESVRRTLINADYAPDLIEVVRQAMPHETAIWEQLGAGRQPGRADPAQLTIAFLGSAYAHKGPQLLVEAAQRTAARVRVRILGEVPDAIAAHLRALDRRGVVEIHGSFDPTELSGLLAGVDAAALPSMWWDCAPLAAAEARGARLPLLVPRLGGLIETIVDDHDGLAFAALDPDDLARQIDRLAGEPGLLERLQANITPPPSFAAYVDALEHRYRDPQAAADPAASGGPPPRPAVRWQGDFGLPTSLSIVNDRVCERLDADVQRVGRTGEPIDGPLPQTADVEVRHSWPPDLSPARAGRLATIVPWEFGALPGTWLERIHTNVDELWVPSDYVAGMYRDGGIDPARIQVIPNGVDLEVFRPDPQPPDPDTVHDPDHTRFLFVGGLIPRKGPDVLLAAWRAAFAGRSDVTLQIKDFGADGVYRGADRGPIRDYAASGALPRVELLEDTLSPRELATLYRRADVFVAPYRGEGFAMPVLEAMACGLPVIATAGGPTDEFCPPEAGWRIRAERRHHPRGIFGPELMPAADPWMLEPDVEHLATLLITAAADPAERRRRGAAAAAAARALTWSSVAARYGARIEALAQGPRPVRVAPADLGGDFQRRVLATPAWRGTDALASLLAAWASSTVAGGDSCLYLLADPQVSGEPAQIEAHVLAAARSAGTDLEGCGDIDVRLAPMDPVRDRALHAATDIYVPLHAGCGGQIRLARAAGSRVIAAAELGAALATTQ